MRGKRNVHFKIQELCDCYATADPLKEMPTGKDDGDADEAALKCLALAVLYGINAGAEKILIGRSKGGDVKVGVKYRKTDLPSPGETVGKRVLAAVREMTHIESKKGKLPVSPGAR